jgi:Zn-dependent M32 family carboxypeptidase
LGDPAGTKEADGKTFSIRVVLNFELERELLSFGSKIKVLGPRILVRRIPEQLVNTLARYQ